MARALDRWIIATLSVAVVLLLANTFVLHKDKGAATTAQAPDKSIAVLPLVNGSDNQEEQYFSDGLSEEVRATLARNRCT